MANSKIRLGRGLNSLISGGIQPQKKSKDEVSQDEKELDKKNILQPFHSLDEHSQNIIKEISLRLISKNPYQPRRDFSSESIEDLANSIRSEGLLQPIIVRKKNNQYELIAGERRLRACETLGLKVIPARVVEANDASSAAMALIENLQREDLNPIDEALALNSLMQDFDLTQDAVAQRVGKARTSIANCLRLLNLDKEIQGYIAKNILSIGHAKVILSLEDKPQQVLLARKIIENGMSVRDSEKALKQLKMNKLHASVVETRVSPSTQTVIHNIEKQMTGFFNTKVRVNHGAKKGRIVIEYYGNDDLRRLMDKMGL